MNIRFSKAILLKLKLRHQVTPEEVKECFFNRDQGLLEDSREQHKTLPPTLWFIAETNRGRLLKVVFMELAPGNYEIKTAYEPNLSEVKIYERYA